MHVLRPFGHNEFTAFNASVTALFGKWRKLNAPRLKDIKPGDPPKPLIETLSENLLETFQKSRLLEPYDVYQHLMDFWAAVMQDDVYVLVQDVWTGVQSDDHNRCKPNTDLIPESLIVARYFAKERAAIEQLEADRDAIYRQLEELDEEHGGDEGLLFLAKNDKGKLTKVSVKARLKEIKNEELANDERPALETYASLIEKEAAAYKRVKDSQKALDALVIAKYSELSEHEIKTLVVDDKWLVALAARVQSELNRVSQALTGRVRQLAERYATPLPKLAEEVEVLAARVDEHLDRMGFNW